MKAWLDPLTDLPTRFSKKLSEGRYRCDEITHFDYEQKQARWKSATKDEIKEYAIEENTRDLLSFMHHLRDLILRRTKSTASP